MSNFVASNGVELIWCGCVSDKQPGDGCKAIHEARKEFYQHLRDKELGRWRDPEAPNFVVYTATPDNPNRISVVDENTGHAELYFRYRTDCSDYGDAAARYFEAHPEPKPWHDAKPGEAWLVAHDGNGLEPRGTFLFGGTTHFSVPGGEDFSINYGRITDAKRIWPEGDSDG